MAAQRPQLVGIHLDLKYTMPDKDYLLQWVKRLPKLGINTVLIEYEDKFPFERHSLLRVDNGFSPKELRKFLDTARSAGLKTIPLVQALSHLEFALDHPQLAHLREAPDMPTQICPSNPAAVQFVKELMSDVLAYHQEDEYFHIGGDEAWHLGTCPTCAKRVQNNDKFPLWAEHINSILRFIAEKGKRPIVWDDALWSTPEKVTVLDKSAILHNWNYGVTESTPEKPACPQIEVYKAAGYDVVGGPCLNQGTLVPSKNHCLKNTAVIGKKVQQTGILGVLNTAWACFHVPMPVTWIGIAATGAAFEPGVEIDAAWEQKFWKDEFKTKVRGIPEAMEQIGRGWSLRVEGLGRAIAMATYGYMDMVAWFPGGQSERRRRGIYPNDWHQVDFPGIYLKKLEMYKAAPDKAPIFAKIDELTAAYAQARTVLREVAKTAKAHQEEARLFAHFADMKWLNMRIFSHLMRGDGDAEKLRQELMAQKDEMIESLAPFLDPLSISRMIAIWWDPQLVALSGGKPTLATPVQKGSAGAAGEPEF
jgi:hypothetical protein